MSRKGKIIYKVVTAAFVVATLVLAIYIIVNGLGLSRDLDFGAGAYYYADIPDFEKYTGEGAYKSRLPLKWPARYGEADKGVCCGIFDEEIR